MKILTRIIFGAQLKGAWPITRGRAVQYGRKSLIFAVIFTELWRQGFLADSLVAKRMECGSVAIIRTGSVTGVVSAPDEGVVEGMKRKDVKGP